MFHLHFSKDQSSRLADWQTQQAQSDPHSLTRDLVTLESLAEGAADLCPQEDDLELIIMQLAKDKKLTVAHTDPEKQSKVCLKEIMVSPIKDQSLIMGRRGGGHKTVGVGASQVLYPKGKC